MTRNNITAVKEAKKGEACNMYERNVYTFSTLVQSSGLHHPGEEGQQGKEEARGACF
jgi:hypothetical protein